MFLALYTSTASYDLSIQYSYIDISIGHMAAEVRTSFRAILRHAKRLPTFGSANKEQWNYIVSKVCRFTFL
jgi:hypothetical protein